MDWKQEKHVCFWKCIARTKTETLQEFFPDYRPTFQTCSDEVAIRDMLKKVFDENKILKINLETAQEELKQTAADLWNDIEKLEEENKTIEEKVRLVGHQPTIDACLHTWYGEESDED